jgi:hypothetical protein
MKATIIYQFECSQNCGETISNQQLPSTWTNEVDLTLPDFQSVIEQILDGFVCPTCGNRNVKLLYLNLIRDDSEQLIDLLYGGMI